MHVVEVMHRKQREQGARDFNCHERRTQPADGHLRGKKERDKEELNVETVRVYVCLPTHPRDQHQHGDE